MELQALVQALPAGDREIIILRFYQELSFHEMAEILETPVTTLRYRYKKILKYLRGQWEEDGT